MRVKGVLGAVLCLCLGAASLCIGVSAALRTEVVDSAYVVHSAHRTDALTMAVPDMVVEVADAVEAGHDAIEFYDMDGKEALDGWHLSAMMMPADTFDVSYSAESGKYHPDENMVRIDLARVEGSDKGAYEVAMDGFVAAAATADCDRCAMVMALSRLFAGGAYADTDYEDDSTPWQAVSEGRANCVGWARAAADVCQRLGINAVAATADAGTHAVCVVAIDGKPYMIDGTYAVGGADWFFEWDAVPSVLDDEAGVMRRIGVVQS